MANPAPTINQINAFNATQGTTIDFNIIGGTELVRSNRIYIYDLSDNSLICTHLYVSTESIHELPPNTDSSIVYESGKSSADFVNGKQYYAQIQTFTDTNGTQGGSGLSVAKMFWCLNNPTLTINTIPSTISTTSYNVSATYNANTSVVSNIIQQYQFSLYSATGSLLQSSGVIVGSGEQQGTSTAYDISYNFTGLSVGSSYYVAVDVTTTQGMSVSTQSSTFTVSIDTPTLGEATVVNNACDGYISVTSNLSGEYGGSASGDIVSFETDSENVFTKLQVTLSPTQSGSGTPSPSNVRPIYGVGEVNVNVQGKNLFNPTILVATGITLNDDGSITVSNNNYIYGKKAWINDIGYTGQIAVTYIVKYSTTNYSFGANPIIRYKDGTSLNIYPTVTTEYATYTAVSANNKVVDYIDFSYGSASNSTTFFMQIELNNEATAYVPYEPPTTVSKEFDVSLTPTSTDTDPYLFKAVGDIYGDRLEEDIVGGTVAWNQQLNKDHYSSTTTVHGITYTNNGDGSITVSGTSDGRSNINIDTIQGIPKGHKWLAYGVPSGAAYNTHYLSILEYNANTYQTSFGVYANGKVFTTRENTTRLTIEIVGAQVASYSLNNLKFVPQLFDLTQMFGSTIADYIYTLEQATAGAGVAFFRKYFPKPYYPYDAGTIKSVEGVSAHKTVGFNAFDASSVTPNSTINSSGNVISGLYNVSDYIRIVPNTVYYAHNVVKGADGRTFCVYDANKTFIKAVDPEYPKGTLNYQSNDVYVTTPENAQYAKIITSTPSECCINLSWDGERNGEYEPYVEHSYPLDDSLTLRGIPKIANGKLYFDGDTYKSDGTVTRKYGIVDLGTLNWTYLSDYQMFYSYVSDKKTGVLNLLCSKYPTTNAVWTTSNDKAVSGNGSNNMIYLRDTSLGTDASDFKTAMSGVYLVYELATPTTETADPFEQIQKVSKYGTLEYITTNDVPVGHNTTYLTRDIFGGYIDLVSGQLVVDRISKIPNIGVFSAESSGYSNINYLQVYKQADSVNINNTTVNGLLTSMFTPEVGSNWDSTDNIGKFLTGATYTQYWIGFPKSTTLEQAQATVAGLQICYKLATPLTYQLTPQQIQTLVGVNNVWSEQGDIELSYHIPITNLLVKRQDVDDVSGNWLTLYSQPIEQASDMDFTFIDFLNQYGKTYKYALVPLLTQTQSGVEVEVEGGYTVSDEVQSIFDGVFISDSTGSQKCKANVGYGNVDMNQSVGTITPIGAKYPVVITNSKNQYHNGSIYGTIVPDDYYYNGNLSRIDMVNKRNELEQFLTNKRAKIIKDWNSNIWLVMIMDNIDCSFDNNYGMGIVTFNVNWLEIGDPTNQEDLQATGLVDVGGV